MHFRSSKPTRNISTRLPAIARGTAENQSRIGYMSGRNKRPSRPKIARTITIARVTQRCGSPSGTRRPQWIRFRLSATGWPHSGQRSCGVKPQRLYSQPEQKQSCKMGSSAVIGCRQCGPTVELSCGPATPVRTNNRHCTGLTESAAQRAARQLE